MRARSPNQARRPARVRHQPGAPRAAGVARPAALPENRGAAALPKWIASPGAPWIAVLLAAYGALRFRFVLGLPFLNDDYTILDKVGRASFASLWTAEHPLWGWYRPWSRELHFWVLAHLFGARPLAFHAASLALAAAAIGLYGALARRVAGGVGATIASAGLVAMGAWSGTLLWAAGAQDLWMLVFALLYAFMKFTFMGKDWHGALDRIQAHSRRRGVRLQEAVQVARTAGGEARERAEARVRDVRRLQRQARRGDQVLRVIAQPARRAGNAEEGRGHQLGRLDTPCSRAGPRQRTPRADAVRRHFLLARTAVGVVVSDSRNAAEDVAFEDRESGCVVDQGRSRGSVGEGRLGTVDTRAHAAEGDDHGGHR